MFDSFGWLFRVAKIRKVEAIGFTAPEFELTGIDHGSYNLKNLRGKIVLLEFWSVDCPICAHILPEVNSLIKKKAGEDFVALAVSREEDVAQIKRHLKDHPRDASVVLNNKAIWQTYDRRIITQGR